MVHICHECGETYEAPGFCGRDGARLHERGDDALLGATLGSWRVAELIGTGGMGRVYKAVQPNIGGRVAIKVLNNQAAADAATVQRFFAEARAVNLIRHENIINVLDLATMSDGRPYIVMEYLDGAPLSSLVEKSGALPLGGCASLLMEILDALDAAHAKGIIHRDLKPANVFVTPGGHARLLDFGIAKLAPELDGRTSVTRTGSLLGTPQYMAPEQASAQPLDSRTDLYAVGVMMYELITGQVPFHGASLFDLLRQHLESPPRPPRELRPEIPPALEAVVLTALEKDPNRRFASASAMLDALRAAASDLPPEAWSSVVPGADRPSLRTGATSVTSPAAGGLSASVSSSSDTGAPASTQDGPRGVGAVSTQSAVGRAARKPVAVAVAVAAVLGVAGAVVLSGRSQAPTVADGQQALSDVASPGEGVPARDAPGDASKVSDDSASAPDPRLDTPRDEPVADATAGPAPGETAATGDEAATDNDSGDGKAAEPAGGPNPNRISPRNQRRRRRSPASRSEQKSPPERQPDAAGTGSSGTAGAQTAAPQFRQLPLDSIDVDDFDAWSYLRKARKMAREYFPDARLTYAYIQNVKPNGRADLTLGQAIVTFMFRSKKASVRGDLPRGVTMQCKVVVTVIPASGITVAPTGDHNCADVILGMPKCSPKQLWDKALAAGAPKNAVAALMFNRYQGQNRWIFTIGSDFTQILPDDC